MNRPEREQPNLACPKHGPAPWWEIHAGQFVRRYCLFCVDEVLTRMGVRGMFPVKAEPVVEPEPVEWPEELLEVE